MKGEGACDDSPSLVFDDWQSVCCLWSEAEIADQSVLIQVCRPIPRTASEFQTRVVVQVTVSLPRFENTKELSHRQRNEAAQSVGPNIEILQ